MADVLSSTKKALKASLKRNVAVSKASGRIADEGPLLTRDLFNSLLGQLTGGLMNFDQWLVSPDGQMFNSQRARIRNMTDAAARAEVGDFFAAQGEGGFEAKTHASNILASAGSRAAGLENDLLLNAYRMAQNFQSGTQAALGGVIQAGIGERLNFLNQDTMQSNALGAETARMLELLPGELQAQGYQNQMLGTQAADMDAAYQAAVAASIQAKQAYNNGSYLYKDPRLPFLMSASYVSPFLGGGGGGGGAAIAPPRPDPFGGTIEERLAGLSNSRN